MHKYLYTHSNVSKTFRITIVGVYSALTFALQVALSFIPNVELASFMISFAAIVFPITMALTINFVFITLEAVMWGFADWVLTYVVAWTTLTLVCIALCRVVNKQWFFFVLINAIFGYLFGTIDSVMKIPLYGWNFFYGYWLKGLIFDFIDGTANLLLAYFLYRPVHKLWSNNLARYFY